MWRAGLQELFQAGLDLLAPLGCPLCGSRLVGRTACPRCRFPDRGRICRELHGDARGEYLILGGGAFAGRQRKLVHAFKYRQDPGALALLRAQTLLALPHDLTWNGVVAVPTHPLRARERGWQAVSWLAGALACAMGQPLTAALVRRQATPPLTGYSLIGRRRLLEGCFHARPVTGCLLLVDDVYTTGATFGACRRALLAAGAVAVDLLVAARTPNPPGRRL